MRKLSIFFAVACTLLLSILAAYAQAQAPMVVYDDGLQSGWDNWSWAKVEFADPIGGAKPIKVEGDAWSALALHHAPFSTKGYSNLVFYMNGGVDGGQSVAIKLTVAEKNTGKKLRRPARCEEMGGRQNSLARARRGRCDDRGYLFSGAGCAEQSLLCHQNRLSTRCVCESDVNEYVELVTD